MTFDARKSNLFLIECMLNCAKIRRVGFSSLNDILTFVLFLIALNTIVRQIGFFTTDNEISFISSEFLNTF